MPGEAAGDRVDAEPDVDTPCPQPRDEVGDGVLRLGDGHAVPGRDDDGACLGEHLCDLDGGGLVVLAVVRGVTVAGGCAVV